MDKELDKTDVGIIISKDNEAYVALPETHDKLSSHQIILLYIINVLKDEDIANDLLEVALNYFNNKE